MWGEGSGKLHHSGYMQAHLIPGLRKHDCSPGNPLGRGGQVSPLPVALWENLQSI